MTMKSIMKKLRFGHKEEVAKPVSKTGLVRRQQAVIRAKTVVPHIEKAKAKGHVSLQDIANYLNDKTNVKTPRGCAWSKWAVRDVLALQEEHQL